MRYMITDDLEDPDVLVEVKDPTGRTATLRQEHPGLDEFISELRAVIAAHREDVWSEHQLEKDGVPIDVVDRKQLFGQFEHANLLASAARAIEEELF